jgi:toxin CcdB
MSRFDLYRGLGSIDYFLDVQADFHDHLSTRVVIPLLAAHKIRNLTRGLHVPIMVADAPYYLVTPMMAAMPKSQLGKALENREDLSYDITAAIDFLLQGF